MQLCQKSKEVFVHFVKTLANDGVFLICKVNGAGVLDPPEKWTALFKIVEGELKQQSLNYGQRHKGDGDDAYQILTMQRYGTTDQDDVRRGIRGTLFQIAIGTTQGIADIINIAEDLAVPLGDPISYHPDDEMCYEIRVPPDGSCFLHAQQVRLDPNDWLKAERSNKGYATDSARVQLECALAKEKSERLFVAFADHFLVTQAVDIVENRYQVEKEVVRTIARTLLLNIRITLSPAMRKLASEDDWDCLYQLDDCDKDDVLHVLLTLLDSGSGHYTALMKDWPAGCVYEAGCVKLVRIAAKPRTTQRIHGTSFDIVPLNDSFAKATPLHDNERYIENSESQYEKTTKYTKWKIHSYHWIPM